MNKNPKQSKNDSNVCAIVFVVVHGCMKNPNCFSTDVQSLFRCSHSSRQQFQNYYGKCTSFAFSFTLCSRRWLRSNFVGLRSCVRIFRLYADGVRLFAIFDATNSHCSRPNRWPVMSAHIFVININSIILVTRSDFTHVHFISHPQSTYIPIFDPIFDFMILPVTLTNSAIRRFSKWPTAIISNYTCFWCWNEIHCRIIIMGFIPTNVPDSRRY